MIELLNAAELDALCYGVSYDPSHEALLKELQDRYPDAGMRLVAVRGEWKRVDGRLLESDGSVVADNWQDWIRKIFIAHGEDAREVWAAYHDLGMVVTEYRGETLYLAAPYGEAPDAWYQIEIESIKEIRTRELLSSSHWSVPEDLDDLLHPLSRVPETVETITDWSYQFVSISNIRRYLRNLVVCHNERRQQKLPQLSQRRIQLINLGTESIECETVSFLDLHPDWLDRPPAGIRFFQDWAGSSAGRAGHRLCDHWVMRLHEYDENGHHHVLDIIPVWADADGGLELPNIEVDHEASSYAVMAELEQFDQQAGYPMAWFFYLLHGNRINESAGFVVARGLREGRIGLPTHDAEILLRWAASPYGF